MKTKIAIAISVILLTTTNGIAKETKTIATSKNTTQSISKKEVIEAQRAWAEAIVAIGNAYTNKGDYKALAAKTVDEMYAYDEGTVLFKPTKAAVKPFRTTEKEALSYFVTGCDAEDHGFALQPWTKVRFVNSNIVTDRDSAMAMGEYFFTDGKTNKEVKVEYTFGYIKDKNGKLLINLHHSSIPYAPATH